MVVAKNIIIGMVANSVYDIVKYITNTLMGSGNIKKDDEIKKSIKLNIENNMPSECKHLQDSGCIELFMNSPQIFDIINSYLMYKIIGIQKAKITEIKENKKVKNQIGTLKLDDIVNILSTSVLKLYEKNDTLTIPEKRILNKFFLFIIECSEETIFSIMNIEEISTIYFINSHVDLIFDNLDHVLTELSQNVQRLLEISIVKAEKDYEEIRKEYYKILKTKNSEAHIYLLDKFDFDKFYVPPILSKNPHDSFMYANNSFSRHSKEIFESWKYIFAQRNIVYIVGGAGYGKSLFMKKIINDYRELNLFHSQEYLVIYGELKMFFPNNAETPISVKEFLQNSIKTSTLLDEEKITYDFIEHYLSIGRCIILLDALDEVDKEKRNALHESIISFFKNQNPNNKICITSRNRGFIPEKDIEVFSICPLNNIQIETYVDKIIRLGKFEKTDKSAFMKQTAVLVEKGFLNSFLVLSLLINIYKAERELPENKLDLYQKCFEYIANKREKDKTQTRYNWEVISPMMKDHTFMELAQMCYPNNTDVDKTTIKYKLINTYKSKYGNEVDTENAIEEFLKFCSDRTELFVPAAGEDKFKFFHRSFFEYFYSQYIFYRCNDVNEILEKLLQFDVDSEVFELTVAMLKQKAENKYQKLIELMINKSQEEFLIDNSSYIVFNILILSMQVVDDILYRNKFLELLLNNKEKIMENREMMHNMHIISDVFARDYESNKKICERYYNEAVASLVLKAISSFEFWNDISKEVEIPKKENIDYRYNAIKMHHYFMNYKIQWNDFYVNIFTRTENVFDVLSSFNMESVSQTFKEYFSRKALKELKKQIKQFSIHFNNLNFEEKQRFCTHLINM